MSTEENVDTSKAVRSRPAGAQPPESDRPWSIETNGIEPIAEEERHGRPFELFWIWCAANIGILDITYGAYLVTFYGLNLTQAILVLIAGTVLSFLLVGFISLAGKLTNAPTLVISRAPFGVKGNGLPTLISYVNCLGWEILLTALAVLAAQSIMQRIGAPHGTAMLAIAFVIIAGGTIVLALLGHATIARVQQWCTYAFAALTVVFVILEAKNVNMHAVSSLHAGKFLAGVVGGATVIMAGYGLGWVNAAGDYSRYLPRKASSAAVVGWTTLGSSVAPILLGIFGIFLAASNPNIASSANPIGLFADTLPTWFAVPYLLVAVGATMAAVVLNVYSGGLNLLALGLRTDRYKTVAIDACVMIAGNIYVLFIAKTFFAPFEGFLITLGVLLAAWSGIFLADMALLRWRTGYDEQMLYRGKGFNWRGLAALVIAGTVGLGAVTSTSPVFSWVGYLLGLMGGKTGAVGGSSIGVIIALALGSVSYGVLTLATGQLGKARVAQAAAVPGPDGAVSVTDSMGTAES
jgi:nucleobase:cation symporter-1, NCS1 family